jgi:dimeric dUTPase (all-alpha-NTP-PPase superfamily)
MAERDMLAEIFECQKALNRRIGVDTDAMGEEQQVHWLLNYSRALTQETAELVDSLPWKWWAKYQTYDRANVQVEIVDLLHFLVSLAQVAGLSAQDMHELYMKKNRVNFQRQETGYATKDDGDNADVKLDRRGGT